jgi:hypothetical protein
MDNKILLANRLRFEGTYRQGVLNSKYKLQLLPANTYLEAALLWHMLWVELTTICRTKPKKE